jgi:hypothetical protein
VEPELEPLAAFKGEVEPRFGGFTWLQLEIHERSYFAKRFLKRLNSTIEVTLPEEPEPFLEKPEPYQTDPNFCGEGVRRHEFVAFAADPQSPHAVSTL